MGRGSPVVFRVTSILTEFEQAKGRILRNSRGVAGRQGISPSQNERIKSFPRKLGSFGSERAIRVMAGWRRLSNNYCKGTLLPAQSAAGIGTEFAFRGAV